MNGHSKLTFQEPEKKNGHPEHDDCTIGALMRYFRFNEYRELKLSGGFLTA